MASARYKIVLQQTFISTFLSFLSFAFGFIRVSFFSKRMSVEDFGMLSLLISYSTFLLYVFTIGSFQYLFKRVNDGDDAKRTGLWSSLGVTTIICTFGTVLAFVFSGQICTLLNISKLQTDFKLTILATDATAVATIFMFYHYGQGRNNFQNLLQFLRASLWVIVTVVASYFIGVTLRNVLLIFNFCIFAVLLLSIPWKELRFLVGIKSHSISFKPVLKYCIPLLPYFAGVWGIPTIIRSQLNIVEGPKIVALFNVSYTLIEIIFLFVSSITATLSPYFFASSKEKSYPDQLYNIMLKYSVVLVLLIVPFVYIGRFDIILLLTSEKYRQAGDYIPLLLFLPLLRMLILVFEQVYLKESKTIFLGSVHGLAILLSLLLSTFLIPRFGITGAIYSSLGSYLFLFISLYWKQRRQIDYTYQNLGAICAFVVLVWTTVLLTNFLPLNSFIKILLVGIVVGLGLLALPVFSRYEKQKFLSLLKIKYVLR